MISPKIKISERTIDETNFLNIQSQRALLAVKNTLKNKKLFSNKSLELKYYLIELYLYLETFLIQGGGPKNCVPLNAPQLHIA
jgi:hypothetical protein